MEITNPWKHLQIEDLRQVLAADELRILDKISVEEQSIVNRTMDTVSDVWRGALSGKGYTLDTRDCYVPPEYAYWILVHCRYAVWSRFPQSSLIAIDKVREEEYKKAMDLLKSPWLNVSKPEDEYNPEKLDPKNNAHKGAIEVPFMREEPLSWWC